MQRPLLPSTRQGFLGGRQSCTLVGSVVCQLPRDQRMANDTLAKSRECNSASKQT
jgi:hypothetical protein